MIQTIDGGYVFIGFTTQNIIPGDSGSIYVVKTNASGNIIWQKVLGGGGETTDGYDIKQTSDKGFIITGCDATTNILLDAEVKIIINAKLEKCVKRRAEQMNLTEEETLNDLFRRDIKSFDLIKEAKRVSKEIDTTNLNIEESLEEIMKYVLWKKFHIRYGKIFKFLFIIIIILVASIFKNVI